MKDIVAQFRDAIPGVTVRTTVLVGFPGETDAAFDNLLAFVEDVAFDRLGVFTYSVEEGTPAADHARPGAGRGDGGARAAGPGDSRTGSRGRARRRSSARARPCSWTGRARTPPSPSRGGSAGQAPEIDGVVLPARSRAHARALRRGPHRRGGRLRAGRGVSRSGPPIAWPSRIASVGGAGYSPVAPGTVGSFVDRSSRSGSSRSRRVAPRRHARRGHRSSASGRARASSGVLGRKDPGVIVIDEVAGMMRRRCSSCRGPFPSSSRAFLLFRLFDIWKPFPARESQALAGGLGVMVDDLIAGVYALVLVAGRARALRRPAMSARAVHVRDARGSRTAGMHGQRGAADDPAADVARALLGRGRAGRLAPGRRRGRGRARAARCAARSARRGLVVVLAAPGGSGGEVVRRVLARLTGARLVLNDRLLALLEDDFSPPRPGHAAAARPARPSCRRARCSGRAPERARAGRSRSASDGGRGAAARIAALSALVERAGAAARAPAARRAR